MSPFMAISTGTISDIRSPLQIIERITPLPAPISTPVGPFILSTQPGSGSATAGVTVQANQKVNFNRIEMKS